MKQNNINIFLFVTFLAFLQSFCYTNEGKSHQVDPKSKLLKFGTTLDSLQGTWHIAGSYDTKMSITGRRMDIYVVSGLHTAYDIYFSDVPILDEDFTNVTIDTSATSGLYIIKVALGTNTMWCYEYSGINDNGIEAAAFSLTLNETPFPRISYEKDY
ncbi:MAG: hypothetical protein V4450_17575 [Bacteroidota bacterium]